MPRPVVKFPDAVFVVVEYLRMALSGPPVGSRVPDPMPAEFVRVQRIGGLRGPITDRPRVDVQAWATTEDRAWSLCEDARAYVMAMAGKRGETTVSHVSEVSGPMWLPDASTGRPKYAFAVEFTTRGVKHGG
ncbi:tail terminator [Streptomyces phage SF1]|uniref:Uncharacterized protein n=2 Tax=Caudoviricetes TaxID=2731619 RepID=A0A0K1Y590_9CAUD|nr:tail terminator [Streptomyces phage SF1]YP_009796733.1 tail terminator [Streptomyces phage AbbeyMikolon]AKY02159.1 hypothetical protein SF1_100 [Streptomyces phage SF1]AUG87083.1 head-to-tail connector complex protein [Streptomyces phage AbbeyMikolon]